MALSIYYALTTLRQMLRQDKLSQRDNSINRAARRSKK
jgi:hypothetical protein